MTSCRLSSGSFDVVFAMCVWHHIPPNQWTNFISELSRVLSQEGLLLVYEHNPLNPLTRRVVSRCAFDKDAVLLSLPRPRESSSIRFREDKDGLPVVPAVKKQRPTTLGGRNSSENSFGGTICVVRHTAMTNRATRSVSVVVPTYGNAQGLEPLVRTSRKRFNEKIEFLKFSSSTTAALTLLGMPLNG